MCPPKSTGDNVLFWGMIICVSPLLLSLGAYFSMRDNYKSRRARTPPNVTRRKRALSLPRKNGIAASPLRGQTAAQTHSILYKLPAELRMMIYEEVIGKGRVHLGILQGDKGRWEVRSYRCPGPQPPHIENSGLKSCFDRNCVPFIETHDLSRSGLGVIGLLQSCRSIYSEAIDLLYETPTFLFHDYYAIITFMSSILPQRFNAIRSLYIDQRGAGFNATSDWRFNERNNFNCTRHRNTVIRNPLLTSGKVAPKELSSFRLIAEIVCRMPALQELHLDLMFNGLFPLKYIMTIERPDAEIVEEVAPVIEMLQLKILEGVKVKATFDRLPGEAAHWIDLPFVQVRGWI